MQADISASRRRRSLWPTRSVIRCLWASRGKTRCRALFPDLVQKRAACRPPFFKARSPLFALLALAMRELFADSRGFAGAIAKVIELCAPYVPLALDFNARDQRRISLKRPLHAFTAGNLAHDERRIEPPVALGDHDAFIGLHPLAFTFDNADVDDDRVARGEFRNGLAKTGDLFLFQRVDDVHCISFRPMGPWPGASRERRLMRV